MVRPERTHTLHSVGGSEVDESTATLNTFVPTPSVLASAVRYAGKSPRIYVPPKPWQMEAYRHYGICGEARFAANWIANALSRVTLYPVKDLISKERITSGEPANALADLFGGPLGQIQMMHALGLHMTIAGEAYIVGRAVEGTEDAITNEKGEVWEVLSVTEVSKAGSTWEITDPEDPGKPNIPLTEDDVVIRIWRPDPSRRRDADSPFKSLLPVLSEIEWATKHIFSQMASRLAGAGLLFVSDGVQIAEAPRTNEDGDTVDRAQSTATALMTALATAMMRPLADPSAPEALVPLILTVPEELLKSGKIAELMHFWSDLDEKAMAIRSDAIFRFADGMDIPAEKLKGLSSSPSTGGGNSNGPNHWGMWQIDEEAIKLHIEPAAELIGHFLAIAYLRPLDGVPPLTAVWYDSSALRLRPDRSKESLELYDRGLVSAEVVLRENRFDPDNDKMGDEERKTWLMLQIVTGKTSATPDVVAAALRGLGVQVPEAPAEVDQAPRAPRATPAIAPSERALPEAANAVLMASAEPLVFRALERAGNRLKQQARQQGLTPPQVPSYNLHTVVAANGSAKAILEDAFTGTAAMCLEGRADVDKVVPVLESYVANLLIEKAPHSRDRLEHWLAASL